MKTTGTELGGEDDSGTIIEAIPTASMVVGSDGCILAVNRRAAELCERSVHELVGQCVDELVPQKVRRGHATLRAQALAHGVGEMKASRPDLEVLTASGRLIPVAIALSQVRWRGRGAHLACLTDLRRVVRAEEKLRFVSDRLEETQDVAGVGYWDWDIENGDVSWSSQVYRIFGLEPGEFGATYDAFLEAVHPDDRAYVTDCVERSVAGECNYSIDHRIARRDGEVRVVHEQGKVWRDMTGQAVRMLGTVLDVTERVTLSDELARTRRLEALARLAVGVAHDFSNILAVIDGSAQLARRHLPPDDGSRFGAYVDGIADAASRGADLVDRLMAVGRRQPMVLDDVDVGTALASLTNAIAQTVGAQVEVNVSAEQVPLCVRMHPTTLEQLIMNLVINARDAIEGRGHISIALSRGRVNRPSLGSDVDSVILSVRDDGPGIPLDVLPRLFEPFFTTKAAGAGNGLGLASCQGIVDQVGGVLEGSNHPDGGALFTAFLPVVAPRDEDVATRSASGELTGSEREALILVVDDDPAVRGITVRALRRIGLRIAEAPDADEALRILVTQSIDVLVTDVFMPGMTGPDLARHARTRRPGLRVLLLSGGSEELVEAAGEDAARDALLRKPFKIETLQSRVRALLRQRAL